MQFFSLINFHKIKVRIERKFIASAKDRQNWQFETPPYFRDKFVILSALDVYYGDLYDEPCT